MSTDPQKKRLVLELCFISLLGIVVLGAFVAALSYDFISARAPLFIMLPLLLLIGVQFNRARKQVPARELIDELSLAIRRQNGDFNRVAGFIALMLLLLLLIYVAGHYIGISVFMFVLLKRFAKESWLLSALVSVGVTVLIYVLFEHGFSIELYRGALYRQFI